MSIVSYNDSVLRDYTKSLDTSYVKKLTKGLLYNEFACKAMKILKEHPEENNVRLVKPNTHIKIAPSAHEMLRIMKEHQSEWDEIEAKTPQHMRDFKKKEWFKSIVKPVKEFDFTPPTIQLELNGEKVDVPIWFNSTYSGINLRPGFSNGDSSKPARLTLDSEVVHAMGGGATGAGKSVMLNTIEATLLLEYAPWEITLILCDFKKVEASRFANRIETPHVDIVAATSSTEYTMSVFKYLQEEMNARQSLYQQLGVQKNEDLIAAIDMIVPQVLLIADEYTQLYENIKASESMGNDHADEDKRAINSAISDVARLGRSMGVHMFVSSQQLDDLEEGVANQFKAGVSVFAPPAVSTSLIGNTAASTIRGKGKCYINKNKPAKLESDNELVRIPYINSEPDPNDPEKPTNLLEILAAVKAEADKLGYSKKLSYFNEDDQIPYRLFARASEDALAEYNRIKSSDVIEDKVKAKNLSAIIPLGKPVRYNNLYDGPAFYEFNTFKNESVMLASTAKEDLLYIIDLLCEGISKYEDTQHEIVVCDEVLYTKSKLSDFKNAKLLKRPMLNEATLDLVATRSKMVDYQSAFDDLNNGNLDLKYLLEYYGKSNRNISKSLDYSSDEIYNMLKAGYEISKKKDEISLEDFAEELNVDISDEIAKQKLSKKFDYYIQNLSDVANDAINFEYLQSIYGHIESTKFARKFVWILGFDNFDFSDYEFKASLKDFFANCSKVNVFCLVTADVWTKAGSVLEFVENVIEVKANSAFFSDVSLKRNININQNTIQVCRKTTKSSTVISQYKM